MRVAFELCPSHSSIGSPTEKTALYTKHRETIISQVGFCVFVSGNRQSTEGNAENSPGVIEEYAIAVKGERVPIPFGASGWSSRHIWNEVNKDRARHFRGFDVDIPFELLNTPNLPDAEYIGAIIEIIRRCSR